MNCKQSRELMNKATDGLLSENERALLDQHLAECPRCAEESADLVSFDGVLSKALPLQETLGDGFAARVANGLPARRRLSILKEVFTMSRLKYAVIAVVM